MNSLVSYGSDEENDNEQYGHRKSGTYGGSGTRRKEDDTNYDEVNMDMSEDSQGGGSEHEAPPADAVSSRHRAERTGKKPNGNSRQDTNDSGRKSLERRERRRDSPTHKTDKDRRSPRKEDKYSRSGRSRHDSSSSRHGLQGDRSDDTKSSDATNKIPGLMDLKPSLGDSGKSQDTRDAASPRFQERDRRDKDKHRERERERDRYARRSEERRSGHRHEQRSRSRDRSKPRGAAHPPPDVLCNDRRGSPSGTSDYRPSSYKVNRKLEVMEKMGLQIKTPDGSMATAQQLRQAQVSTDTSGLPSYYNPCAVNTSKILDQVQKRKLLWSSKTKAPAAEPAGAWSGTRFAQDNDGKQAEKFMRLMGIKDPNAVATDQPDTTADPIKKQEEMFQAMQAQYEVARATTHTMRGVGLGFQRGQY